MRIGKRGWRHHWTRKKSIATAKTDPGTSSSLDATAVCVVNGRLARACACMRVRVRACACLPPRVTRAFACKHESHFSVFVPNKRAKVAKLCSQSQHFSPPLPALFTQIRVEKFSFSVQKCAWFHPPLSHKSRLLFSAKNMPGIGFFMHILPENIPQK